MKRNYIKRTFIDGDWYIAKHLYKSLFEVVYIRGFFTLKVGDIIDLGDNIVLTDTMSNYWIHEWLTREQIKLEII